MLFLYQLSSNLWALSNSALIPTHSHPPRKMFQVFYRDVHILLWENAYLRSFLQYN